MLALMMAVAIGSPSPAKDEKSIELNLPAQTTLGQLQYRLGTKNASGRTLNAAGSVKFPIGVAITLTPSSYLLKHPEQLKLLHGTVSGIVIKGERGKVLLPQLAGDKHIHGLKIEDAIVDSKLTTAINTIPELKDLAFNRPSLKSESNIYDQIHRFNHLETLRAEGGTALMALGVLERATALKKLELSGIPLNKNDFEKITKLPNLHYLSLEKCDYPDAVVEKFPQMKALKILWLDLRHWKSATIAPFKKMQKLEELHLSVYENEWHLLDELHKAMPSTDVD